MRLPLSSTKSARAVRALVPVAALTAAVGLTGTSSAASGHNLAESARTSTAATSAHHGMTPFTLLSPDFADGSRLPAWTAFGGPYGSEVGCTNKNQSPALDWFNAPTGTQSFALFVHDVDAPKSWGFTH